MRILIGLQEIASVSTTYGKGFRALGHQTRTVVLSRNPFYPDAKYDVVIRGDDQSRPSIGRALHSRALMLRQFLHGLMTCDMFVYMGGTSFLPHNLDYPILKSLGKRLVCTFWGSDIRYGCAFEQEMRALGLEYEVKPFIDYTKGQPSDSFHLKRRLVRAAECHADLILSQPGYGQLQTRPYMRANVPIDLSQFRFNVPERQIPLVLHAPSNPAVKGTDIVLSVVNQLKQEGLPFEFRLIQSMPNAGVRELLAEADIVVDELYAETVGVLSLEAMASGCAVLVRYLPDYARVPAGCPAINVTKDTLAENLRLAIIDGGFRRKLALAGRPYVEAHHDHVRVCQSILGWLREGSQLEYDFSPSFYRAVSVPADILKEETRKVRDLRMKRLHSLLFGRPEPRGPRQP